MGSDEYVVISIFYNFLVEPFLKATKKIITDMCKTRRARRVIDICCGTGTQCFLLSREGIQTIGIDISPAMLKTTSKMSLTNAIFINMDSKTMGFKKNVFDGAIISFAMHEKTYHERIAIVNEAKRIVKNHGFILVADYIAESVKTVSWEIRFIERMAGRIHYRCFTDFCARGGLIGIGDLFRLPHKLLETFRDGSWGLLLIEMDKSNSRR